MKKILLILISIYTFSFATDWTLSDLNGKSCSYEHTSEDIFTRISESGCTVKSTNWKTQNRTSSLDFEQGGRSYTTVSISGVDKCYEVSSWYSTWSDCVSSPDNDKGYCPKGEFDVSYNGNRVYRCNSSDGTFEVVPNPYLPNGYGKCPDLFEKDGIVYNCNPNTNEATPIPNSSGTEEDEDGNTYPKCDDGFENDTKLVISPDGNRTEQSCVKKSDDGTDTPITPTSPNLDNTSSKDNGDGTTTITYPDGSTTTHNNSDNTPVSSTPKTNNTGGGGGGGTNGSGGTGGGNDTSGEGGENGDNEDITPPSVASSCNDSSLTLEQKMLCELNQGMKNQNSESNPSNSINNLLKDLIKNNQKDNTAINKNTKYVADNTAITNSKLTAINNGITGLKTINQQIVINTNKTNELLTPPADNGKAQVDTLDTFINDDSNFIDTIEATTEIKSTISSNFTSYSNSLKNQLLGLYDSLFNINTSNLPPLGLEYNLNLFGSNLQGTFLDEQTFNKLKLDGIAIIIIFSFSLLGFFHAFKFIISSSTVGKDK